MQLMLNKGRELIIIILTTYNDHVKKRTKPNYLVF